MSFTIYLASAFLSVTATIMHISIYKRFYVFMVAIFRNLSLLCIKIFSDTIFWLIVWARFLPLQAFRRPYTSSA